MKNPNAGILEKTGIRMTQEQGDALKKSNDEIKSLLDSIGSTPAPAASGKPAPAVTGGFAMPRR